MKNMYLFSFLIQLFTIASCRNMSNTREKQREGRES